MEFENNVNFLKKSLQSNLMCDNIKHSILNYILWFCGNEVEIAMDYKIIVDSCGEFTEQMKQNPCFESVALTLEVGGVSVVDDQTFDQAAFLRMVRECPDCPKSSCPSPDAYVQSYTSEAKRIYVVTLSAELSGSYNSAVLAKNLYLEEHQGQQIHVFNSCSASVGETNIALKIQECEEQGMDFEQVVRTVEDYIEHKRTYFVLETLETLRKNGRLTGIKAVVASVLNIKPVMGADRGTIIQLDQARGMNKALAKMADYIIREVKEPEKKRLAISHCNCPERAKQIREDLLKRAKFRDIIILNTAGVSTMYANDGGVIVSV